MALSTKPYKGARDFYPEDKRLQKYMFAKLRQVAERYGYEEYDAPILEPLDIYLAKTGEEIVNEQTYVFEDRGGRQVVIRPEMTPTVSRMVAAKRQELAYPLRWYSIPNLWRYERPQRGRLREHWQLNVDIFGVEEPQAEIEIVTLVDDIFQSFGAGRDSYAIRLNDRRLVDHFFKQTLGLSDGQAVKMGKLIDRLHKIDRSDFIARADEIATPAQREQGSTEKLLGFLEAKTVAEVIQLLDNPQITASLDTLLQQLKMAGLTNATFDPSIMRGFDYYTGIVFEVFDLHPDNNRSMLGGGRYDGLVGLFGVEPVPTVGFGFGDVTLANFLELHNLVPPISSETQVYAVLAGDVLVQAQPVIQQLRADGVNVAMDLSGRKLGDQLKTASKKHIPYALIIGETELAAQRFSLKNLENGREESLSIPEIITRLKEEQ